ncbi:MAG: hypothetical protein M5R36_29910 [Deltaproteobacteria bacterium]|nr:hypothetical protein [Deltaproteobacteria bacterium]
MRVRDAVEDENEAPAAARARKPFLQGRDVPRPNPRGDSWWFVPPAAAFISWRLT